MIDETERCFKKERENGYTEISIKFDPFEKFGYEEA